MHQKTNQTNKTKTGNYTSLQLLMYKYCKDELLGCKAVYNFFIATIGYLGASASICYLILEL